MTDVDQRVLAETLRFREVLPQLMTRYRGRWVVFRDGTVASDHETEGDALAAAVERFGVDGGFVVAPVSELRATPVTAGVHFGLP
jgi:hypothetical protein